MQRARHLLSKTESRSGIDICAQNALCISLQVPESPYIILLLGSIATNSVFSSLISIDFVSVCASMWRSEVHVTCLPQLLFVLLVLLRQALSLELTLTHKSASLEDSSAGVTDNLVSHRW